MNTPDAELREKIENINTSRGHESVRLVDLSNPETIDEIMKLITADRSRLVREIKGIIPKKTDFPKVSVEENSPAFVQGSEYGWLLAISRVAALLDEWEK